MPMADQRRSCKNPTTWRAKPAMVALRSGPKVHKPSARVQSCRGLFGSAQEARFSGNSTGKKCPKVAAHHHNTGHQTCRGEHPSDLTVRVKPACAGEGVGAPDPPSCITRRARNQLIGIR